jgi:hypothetical protein
MNAQFESVPHYSLFAYFPSPLVYELYAFGPTVPIEADCSIQWNSESKSSRKPIFSYLHKVAQ